MHCHEIRELSCMEWKREYSAQTDIAPATQYSGTPTWSRGHT